MVGRMLMLLVGIMVSQPVPLLIRGIAVPTRCMWSPSYWSDFDLALHLGVAVGMDCFWSAVVLTVAILRKTVRDPAA